jgi:hypothetical protein
VLRWLVSFERYRTQEGRVLVHKRNNSTEKRRFLMVKKPPARLKAKVIPDHDPCAVGKVTPDQLVKLQKPKAPTPLAEDANGQKDPVYYSPETKLADPV